jgi:hypothetical protein
MSGFRKRVRAVDFWQKVLMMTREDLDALGVELMAADDAADPRRLAARRKIAGSTIALAGRLRDFGGRVSGGGAVAAG